MCELAWSQVGNNPVNPVTFVLKQILLRIRSTLSKSKDVSLLFALCSINNRLNSDTGQ